MSGYYDTSFGLTAFGHEISVEAVPYERTVRIEVDGKEIQLNHEEAAQLEVALLKARRGMQ